MNGWISIHRKITEHWIWQDPVKLKWWIDILLIVNHDENKINIGMQLIECKRGQTIMSLSNWAKRWRVSRDTARNFLVLLEKDGMIHTENLTKTTRITVCKYDAYQNTLHDGQTLSERQPNASQTLADTNNNDNNVNNENKKNIVESEVEIIDEFSFDKVWDLYDKKVGDKVKLKKKWNKITADDKAKIFDYIPLYKLNQPDKKYRKNFETFLNNKSWNDELIEQQRQNQGTQFKGSSTESGQKLIPIGGSDTREKDYSKL